MIKYKIDDIEIGITKIRKSKAKNKDTIIIEHDDILFTEFLASDKNSWAEKFRAKWVEDGKDIKD